jgi:hypothetical protein
MSQFYLEGANVWREALIKCPLVIVVLHMWDNTEKGSGWKKIIIIMYPNEVTSRTTEFSTLISGTKVLQSFRIFTDFKVQRMSLTNVTAAAILKSYCLLSSAYLKLFNNEDISTEVIHFHGLQTEQCKNDTNMNWYREVKLPAHVLSNSVLIQVSFGHLILQKYES